MRCELELRYLSRGVVVLGIRVLLVYIATLSIEKNILTRFSIYIDVYI